MLLIVGAAAGWWLLLRPHLCRGGLASPGLTWPYQFCAVAMS